MMMNIVFAFLTVALLGGALGLGLAFASKKLAVHKDERILQVEEALPGANCGACGFAGCAAYAEAIVTSEADITLCSPGGPDTSKAISQIMGIEAVGGQSGKMVARVHCYGNSETTKEEFSYQGVSDCNAAVSMFGGPLSCKYGCLGLGSCIAVCPVDAISKREDGRIYVDKEVCIGCRKCVTVCPTGVMKMIPYDAEYYIACNSNDKGAAVKKACSVGCIGCKICEKKFPGAGFTITNFLSEIDYSIDAEGQAEAAGACPPSCIRPTD